MSRAATKQAAKTLIARCEEEGVKLPTDAVNAMVAAGTMLNATRENGEYQMDMALKEMIAKFGLKPQPAGKKRTASKADTPTKSKAEDPDPAAEDTKKKPAARKRSTKRARKDDDEDDDAASDDKPTPKKARAKPTADNEANQELADVFAELAGFEFKRGEKFKGGAYSKVAKALRDCPDAITSGKQAMKLKGVGKAACAKIDEYLENGEIAKLEEYRAGNL